MSYVYDCDHRHDLPFAEIKRLVGGKAANLAVMAVDLGLPVPPAFTITTAACNEYPRTAGRRVSMRNCAST